MAEYPETAPNLESKDNINFCKMKKLFYLVLISLGCIYLISCGKTTRDVTYDKVGDLFNKLKYDSDYVAYTTLLFNNTNLFVKSHFTNYDSTTWRNKTLTAEQKFEKTNNKENFATIKENSLKMYALHLKIVQKFPLIKELTQEESKKLTSISMKYFRNNKGLEFWRPVNEKKSNI